MFAELRRALLLREDKAHFDELWNKAEFHVPAAEKAKYPLPINSVLMCMNLEQEKAIYRLEGKILDQHQHIHQLKKKIKSVAAENTQLKGELETLRVEIEQVRKSLREELLEILYPSYTHGA